MRWIASLTAAALAGCALAAPGAGAKTGQLTSFDGVTVEGSPFRYAAFSPDRHTPEGFVPGKHTVVVRVFRDGGEVSRWWTLPGAWGVPAVSYDINGGGGLSADGSTLILTRITRAFPAPVSRFAILDTGIRADDRGGSDVWRSADQTRHIEVEGDLSFHAISPDGSTVYLAERLPSHDGPIHITDQQLRALDVGSERLMPLPILDDDPEAREEGLPVTSATSPDGRWAYMLYDGSGDGAFLEALDTVRGEVASVELPQLDVHRDLFTLQLRTEDLGRTIAVRGYPPDGTTRRTLVAVDAARLEVVGSTQSGTESADSPWIPIDLAIVALTVAAARGSRVAGLRRRSPA